MNEMLDKSLWSPGLVKLAVSKRRGRLLEEDLEDVLLKIEDQLVLEK